MTDFPCAKGSPSGLSGLLLRVWRLSDGRRCIADIATALGTTQDQVLAGLDLLDHVGLLEQAAGAGPLSDLPNRAAVGQAAGPLNGGRQPGRG